MKRFWKDYAEFGWFSRDYIKDTIKSKFKNEEES